MPRNRDERAVVRDGTVDDGILMEALAAGSEEAMGLVYDRLAPGIHAQAVRLVGVASADDVVQDTFERVWRNACRFDTRRGTPPVPGYGEPGFDPKDPPDLYHPLYEAFTAAYRATGDAKYIDRSLRREL